VTAAKSRTDGSVRSRIVETVRSRTSGIATSADGD
jgi:hypothetical protein